MSVIQTNGYEGSSLNDLASATDLKKASLYHRFPNGKKEIASAVLTYVEEWVEFNIIEPISDKEKLPTERLKVVIKNIDNLYDGGEKNCVIRTLTMDNNLELFGKQLKNIFSNWIIGFTNLGVSFGFSEKEAKIKAEQVLILIQGSLIVSKAMSTINPFQQTLISIKNMYKSE